MSSHHSAFDSLRYARSERSPRVARERGAGRLSAAPLGEQSRHNPDTINVVSSNSVTYYCKKHARQVVLADRGAACLKLFFFDEKNRGTSHLLLKATSPSPAASKVCAGPRARGAGRVLALPHVPASYAPFNCDSALRVKYMYVTSLYLRCMEMDACDATRGTHATREG